MRIKYSYYRVPEVPFLRFSSKGRPNPGLLYEYRRDLGFIELSSRTKPYAKGGYVLCTLFGDTDGSWAITGTALCSMSDTFSYKIGRELSLLRATNLGLGHELDIGIMYQMDAINKLDNASKITFLETLARLSESKSNIAPNTMYFHPETALILPEMAGFKVKTSKIILKNHVWIGFEE